MGCPGRRTGPADPAVVRFSTIRISDTWVGCCAACDSWCVILAGTPNFRVKRLGNVRVGCYSPNVSSLSTTEQVMNASMNNQVGKLQCSHADHRPGKGGYVLGVFDGKRHCEISSRRIRVGRALYRCQATIIEIPAVAVRCRSIRRTGDEAHCQWCAAVIGANLFYCAGQLNAGGWSCGIGILAA